MIRANTETRNKFYIIGHNKDGGVAGEGWIWCSRNRFGGKAPKLLIFNKSLLAFYLLKDVRLLEDSWRN